MIAFVKGVLAQRQDQTSIVDVNGVGYEVHMPASDLNRLPPLGEAVTLFTWHMKREDSEMLYGFLDEEDRFLFKILIGVSGVGPKAALAVLSGLSKAQLERAVAEQDVLMLSKLPGIGKKTAERLLLELKDKFKMDKGGPVGLKQEVREDFGEAMEALAALGYALSQARVAMQKVVDQELPSIRPGQDRVAEMVRLALKHL